MSKLLNVAPELIAKNLDYYNIPRKVKNIPFRVRPDIDKEWLIENWVNTPYSMRELAEREGISEGIIDERRAKFKLKKNSKYSVNKNKLFNLDDPNVWYLAGLIATDGHLPKTHDCVEIDLSGDSELQLIQKIKEYFESSAPIGNWGGPSNRLSLTVAGIQQFFLENFNIPRDNKTFDVEIPNNFPSEDCAKAYVLGCMDGDGCVMPKQGFEICCGSEKFVEGIRNIFIKYLNLELKPIRFESRKAPVNAKYPVFTVAGKKAFQILDWIYSTTCVLRLERKYLRYKGDDIV